MFVAWLTSLLPSIPCLFIFQTSVKSVENSSLDKIMFQEECVSSFSGWSKHMKKAYFTAVFMVIFVIPLLVMFCLYSHILIHIRDIVRTNKRIRLMEMGQRQREVSFLPLHKQSLRYPIT